jgi:cyclopropane fatty-acyl-phospholipid synthase-like methyltransferase
MNYGLWEDDTATLRDANIRLVDFIYAQIHKHKETPIQILDIGCGYGEQDIYWAQRFDADSDAATPTPIIHAIDISEKQIYHAMERNMLLDTNIHFNICDAQNIYLKYKPSTFDFILSLESAFHYPDRPAFFKHVNQLLKPDGLFIITDITLKNNYSTGHILETLFIQLFSDFLHFPINNRISASQWRTQLEEHLDVVEYMDKTDETFKPYYSYFMTTFIHNYRLPNIIGNYLQYVFCTIQPFTYNIAICKKK